MGEFGKWRVIVVGGHTRSIGKTQLVCDLIQAFPEAHWIAGKITQYGHGVCARNGKCCDCAPDEHICALTWEKEPSNTDSGRFLTAGAERSLWLRTKQGHLAEGMPLLRAALQQIADSREGKLGNVVLESNTLLEFLQPALYLMVLDSSKTDFKESARRQMERASGFVFRRTVRGVNGNADASPVWTGISACFQDKPAFMQREGDALPLELREWVKNILLGDSSVIL